MIRSWRAAWEQGDFPFYFVQLANFTEKQEQPGDARFGELREAQTMTLALPNTGMAVIIDIGEAKDIHPRNKHDVGERLARIARNRLYGEKKLVYASPTYRSMQKEGNKIVLTFSNTGSGLTTAEVRGEGDYTVRKPGEIEPTGFAVAGGDRKWVWAKARITGPDTMEVWSAAIASPVAVRYAWHANPICNLYNREGLPASPFRTDDWPLLSAPKPAQPPAASYVDGVAPGDTFRYGIHHLKWAEDANGNRLMDLGEVQRRKRAEWEVLDQGDFDITVRRRRTCLYLPNAYVYKRTPTRDLELYIDFPDDWKPTDKRPALLWFFGGAWSVGSPTAFKPQAAYFAKRGAVAICVDYRIGRVDGNDQNDYRGALDGKTAIRWVRKNAAKLGVDPDRIMAGGDSAGGHIPIATQIQTLNDPDDDPAISGKLAALLLHNPYVVRISEESWVFHMDFKTLPPVWIAYGLLDKAAYNDKPGSRREERNGESFIAELKKAGIPLRTYLKEGQNHGFCSGPHLDPSTRDVDAFLQECGLLAPPVTDLSGPITRAASRTQTQAVSTAAVQRAAPTVLAFPTRAPAGHR
jgi:acetyl esterase/lipase